MDLPQLDERLKQARTELFNLRFQAATGQLENHRQIRHVRRQIAQVLTVMQGRRLGLEDIEVEATPTPAAPRTRGRGADKAATAPKTGTAESVEPAAPTPAQAGGETEGE